MKYYRYTLVLCKTQNLHVPKENLYDTDFAIFIKTKSEQMHRTYLDFIED